VNKLVSFIRIVFGANSEHLPSVEIQKAAGAIVTVPNIEDVNLPPKKRGNYLFSRKLLDVSGDKKESKH
jgi:hypothetical protein